MKNNLWILTEERPKQDVVGQIIELFLKEKKLAGFIDKIRIIPIIDNGLFTFTYKITGLDCNKIEKVRLKIVSGKSSFVDYLIFDTINEPTSSDYPVFVIEETKTDDSESRNTGVYQRATKFVYVEYFYPNSKKLMLYNLQGEQKEWATDTNVFGTRCFLTIGVEILGKTLDKEMKPWSNIDELIKFKSKMRRPPKGNVPIDIIKKNNNITITGRIVKSNRLSHDPNIGALSLIAATLRELGWVNDIYIDLHGLCQSMLTGRNKFIRIANRYNIKLKGLVIPPSPILDDYWYYEKRGEKIGTIFLHILIEEFSKGMAIYENHAGCERGYFITSKGENLAVEKYTDKALYKAGDKTQIVNLPDLTVIDFDNKEVIDIEGEMYENANKGIVQLKGFDAFENLYISEHYPSYKIIRTVVLYGSDDEKKPVGEISLLLNNKGKIILSLKAPNIFRSSLKNIFDYWC